MMEFPSKDHSQARDWVFTNMEVWTEIRRRVLTGELSKRAACREYEIHWGTLKKILEHAEPPGYRRSQPRAKPKIEPSLLVIHEILEADRKVHRKQRHSAKRIFDRLCAEHGYDGGETIVKDAVRAWKQTHKEVLIPLSHPPGEAQVDFGFADVVTTWMLVRTFCSLAPAERARHTSPRRSVSPLAARVNGCVSSA